MEDQNVGSIIGRTPSDELTSMGNVRLLENLRNGYHRTGSFEFNEKSTYCRVHNGFLYS